MTTDQQPLPDAVRAAAAVRFALALDNPCPGFTDQDLARGVEKNTHLRELQEVERCARRLKDKISPFVHPRLGSLLVCQEGDMDLLQAALWQLVDARKDSEE